MCEGDWQMWHQLATLLIYLQLFFLAQQKYHYSKKEEEQDNELCSFSTYVAHVDWLAIIP